MNKKKKVILVIIAIMAIGSLLIGYFYLQEEKIHKTNTIILKDKGIRIDLHPTDSGFSLERKK